jgi:hypothetical protein
MCRTWQTELQFTFVLGSKLLFKLSFFFGSWKEEHYSSLYLMNINYTSRRQEVGVYAQWDLL